MIQIKNIQKNIALNLRNEIISGLCAQPKNLPTILLYDNIGIKLFDRITYKSDYYLTMEEVITLEICLNDLINEIHSDSVLVELGCGSLRKTKLILDKLEESNKKIEYFALDLDFSELNLSLENLINNYKIIRLHGLNGTYDDFIRILPGFSNKPITILWLGSSIGNYTRNEAIEFLSSLERNLKKGDKIIASFDTKKDRNALEKAYGDLDGMGTQFIMNALNHANKILSQLIFDLNKFNYESVISDDLSYHESLLKCIHSHAVKIDNKEIKFEKDELIHLEYSFKYSIEEALNILRQSGFVPFRQFKAINSSSLIFIAEKAGLLYDYQIPLPLNVFK
jgi:EasF-like predicted methyltransferase